MNPPPATRKLEVQIMDQSYTLACPEGTEESLKAAVRQVDATMCAIRDAGRIKSRDRIAVLASINIAHELVNSRTGPQAQANQQRLSKLIEKLDQALAGDDGSD